MDFHHIENYADLEKLTQENPGVPIICDLWASWCAPCKRVGPVFEEIAQHNQLRKAIFAKVNAENCRDFLMKNNIRSVPTFLIMENGTIRERLTGACPKPALESFCRKAWCED